MNVLSLFKICLLSPFIFILFSGVGLAEEKHISNGRAVQLARSYVLAKGMIMDDMGLKVMKYYPPYFRLLLDSDMDEALSFSERGLRGSARKVLRDAKEKLESNALWMVKFFYMSKTKNPDRGIVDGVYRVYVDAKTGEILFAWNK